MNADDTTATITISGTPTVASDAVMQIKLPAANLVSSAELNVTANANAKFNISAPATYTVTINAGANMTLSSGNANQSGLSGAMTDTVYTAADGYYFPTDYAVAAVNGISVTRNSYTQITVSGTPTANTTITLTQATAKTKEATPSAAFTADSENGGKLTGVDNTMKYSVNGGSNWLDIAGDNMAITSVTTANGVQVKKPATDANTKLDSDIQSIDVTKSATPTGVTGAACATSANNDGKLQNVTNLMEYKKSDAGSWTDCGGTEVTGLANGTYYVRVKASGTELASDNQTVTVAAYAAPSHTHNWAEDWSGSETHHWHECTAEGCNVTNNADKDGYGEHVYDDDADTTCNTCGYIRTVEPPAHTHSWATAWSNDETYHWHNCTAEGCDVTENSGKDGYGTHDYTDDTDTTCNTCDYERTITPSHTHSWATAWSKDDTHHWHECTAEDCGVTENSDKDGYAEHTASDWITDTAATATTDGSKHKVCTECGYIMAIETIPATGGSVVIIPDTDETDKSEPENPGTGAAVNPGTGAAAAGSSFGYPFVALAAVHAIYTGTKKLAKKDEE